MEKGLNRRALCLFCLLLVLFSGCKRTVPTKSATPDGDHLLSTPTAPASVQTCRATSETITPGPDYSLPGWLAYSTYRGIHFVGGAPLVERLLVARSVGPNLEMAGFSPDGEWFAYYTGFSYEGQPYKLHLLSASGEKRVTVPEYEIVPVQKGSYRGRWYVRWITNEYVIVGTYYPKVNYDSEWAPYDNEWILGILNAFNGEWNNLAPGDLPDHDPDPHHPGTWAFSPDLKRVFCVSLKGQDDGTAIVSLVLWDLEKRIELWQDDRFHDSGFAFGSEREAAWPADGSVLAFGGAETPNTGRQLNHQGIYLLDRDGTRLRLVTDFSSSYETFSTYGLNWSPDGRYLAFMLIGSATPESEATHHIYLYDLVTDRVVHLCQRHISIGFLQDSPVWSPDSRYLAYIDWKDSPKEVRLAKVIDIYTGEVVKVAEGIGRLSGWGWSSAQP